MNRATLMKWGDRHPGAWLCRTWGQLDRRSHRTLPPNTIPLNSVRRLLVVRPGGIGDMILLLPTLRRLLEALPDATLDVVCEQRNSDVLHLAALPRVTPLVYDRHAWSFIAHLRNTTYDVAIDTEQFHHFSAIFTRLSGAAIRIGFKINPTRNPLYTHLVSYDMDGAEADQFLRLLDPLGLAVAPPPVPGRITLPSPTAPAPEGTPPWPLPGGLVVHAGTSTSYKHWRPEALSSVIETLARRYGLHCTLIGSAAEREQAKRIAAGVTTDPPRLVVGDLSLADTARVVKEARLFIGSDSGIAHLATALDTPAVVLFGPSDHLKWGNEGPNRVVVRRPIACAPCFIFGYHKPCTHRQCMAGIEPEDVLTACDNLLGG